MNRFFDRQLEKDRVVILPGEQYVTSMDEVISTVLGSCISVCFRDGSSGISGMNHFMLPSRPAYPMNADPPGGTRFGDEAIALLLSEMISAGASRTDLTAKLFGGASSISKCCERRCVSKENALVARVFLKENGIPLIEADTGGPTGRRIQFDTGSGDVRVEPLLEKGFESCSVILESPGAAPETNRCCKVSRRVQRAPDSRRLR